MKETEVREFAELIARQLTQSDSLEVTSLNVRLLKHGMAVSVSTKASQYFAAEPEV